MERGGEVEEESQVLLGFSGQELLCLLDYLSVSERLYVSGGQGS